MSTWKDNAIWRCPMPQGKTEREQQLELELEQAKAETLRQEAAKINKEQEHWQQVRIQAAIAAMQGMLSSKETMESIAKQAKKHNISIPEALAELSVGDADALVSKLKRSDDVYAECRRMDAINTPSVCENMTKIQKELQKKGGQDE